MELISTLGAIIAGAAAAIVGHFVAHDLYEVAPRHAQRLLNHATRILPETDRERYTEEWLAHLQECTGVIGKFRHAVECLFMAWKLREIVKQRGAIEPDAIEFILLSGGVGTSKFAMDIVTALPVLKLMEEAKGLQESDTLVPTEEAKALLANPDVKRDRILEMTAAFSNASAGGQTGLRISVDRKSVV